MEHRDSPDDSPGPGDLEGEPGADGDGRRPRRRLAGLVGSPTARKVALPRLAAALALALGVVGLLALGGWRLVRSASSWVDRLPEHQVPFASIELSPPPDPWVVGGSARILEEVRREAKRGETVPVLDLDLAELARDFRRNLWVKQVHRVDRSKFGKLVVELSYRQPVAFVRLELREFNAFPVDEEAVVLPWKDIDWTSVRHPFRVKGIAQPLIEIRGLPDATPRPTAGLPWKRKGAGDRPDEPDPMVLRAARLAGFLRDRQADPDAPKDAPVFATIRVPDAPDHPFYLIDAAQNLVCWGKAPGDEGPADPSARDRWAMLMDWTRANGPLDARYPRYLAFGRNGAQVQEARKGRD